VYIFTYLYIYLDLCKYTYKYIHIYTYMYIQLYTYIYIYTFIYIYIYIRTYIHMYIHMYIHISVQPRPRLPCPPILECVHPAPGTNKSGRNFFMASRHAKHMEMQWIAISILCTRPRCVKSVEKIFSSTLATGLLHTWEL